MGFALRANFIVVVWLLSSFRFSSPQLFRIDRMNSKDYFTIPEPKCSESPDYCAAYFAVKDSAVRCRCYCAGQRGTFAFYKQSWKCLENNLTRSYYGCTQPTSFLDEFSGRPLRYLRSDSPQLSLSLQLTGRCNIVLAASSFIDCHEKRAITLPRSAITLGTNRRSYGLQFDLPDQNPIGGRIVNLTIRCTRIGSAYEERCLLFKMEGTTYCNVTGPPRIRATGKSTSKNGYSDIKVTDPYGNLSTAPSTTSITRTIQKFSSSIIALIVGINGCLVVVVIIFGLCIYKRTRSQGHLTITRQTNTSRQPNTRRLHSDNVTHGYNYMGRYISSPYAITDVCLDPPRSLQRPVYDIIDELKAKNATSLYNYTSPEVHQDHVPMSVDQRVYNLVEALNIATLSSTYSYSSSEGRQGHSPVSIDQRVYGLVEELYTPARSGP